MKKLSLAVLLASIGISAYSAATLAHGTAVPEGSKNLTYFKNVQKNPIASMNVPGVNAYFEDVVSSGSKNAPIACGLFKIEKGNPLVYTYDYDDAKIILDGHIYFSDGTQKVKGQPGDVLFFPKGSTITFSTDKSGLAWACGQRKLF
jgi:ethanolamine utilization protein EutQ (cupin superfamily)